MHIKLDVSHTYFISWAKALPGKSTIIASSKGQDLSEKNKGLLGNICKKLTTTNTGSLLERVLLQFPRSSTFLPLKYFYLDFSHSSSSFVDMHARNTELTPTMTSFLFCTEFLAVSWRIAVSRRANDPLCFFSTVWLDPRPIGSSTQVVTASVCFPYISVFLIFCFHYFNFKVCFSAFTLANCGFDVWLGNIRGNTYSRESFKYERTDEGFWDWR